MCRLLHGLIIMKKILSMLLWVFISIFLLWSTVSAAEDSGIKFTPDCLKGICKWGFDYEKIIWISEEQNKNIDAMSIAQDVILAATYMVWTVLTIIIIYCGLMYIFCSANGKDTSRYKKWLTDAMLWALLVRWAYAIVRLIQYIAKW